MKNNLTVILKKIIQIFLFFLFLVLICLNGGLNLIC